MQDKKVGDFCVTTITAVVPNWNYNLITISTITYRAETVQQKLQEYVVTTTWYIYYSSSIFCAGPHPISPCPATLVSPRLQRVDPTRVAHRPRDEAFQLEARRRPAIPPCWRGRRRRRRRCRRKRGVGDDRERAVVVRTSSASAGSHAARSHDTQQQYVIGVYIYARTIAGRYRSTIMGDRWWWWWYLAVGRPV